MKKMLEDLEEKRADVNILIAIILVYSAIKIIAKGPALYSILNPETNSDSPSTKSYGVRLVSAKMVAIQIGTKRGMIKAGQEYSVNVDVSLSELIVTKAINIHKDMPTS